MVRLLAALALFAGAALAVSIPEQQVLADQLSEKWSWEDCGNPDDPIQLKKIEISPDPPKPGQDLTVTVTGTATELIEEGAYADVTVKLGLIKLLSKQFDLCDEARAANMSIQCPVEANDYVVKHTVALPREIPQAKFSVDVKGYTVDDEDLICLKLKIDFMRFPFPIACVTFCTLTSTNSLMPKSSKKKKEKVADFAKAKLRLGKGKRLPSNVIDTSFKARSIALPTQSIAIEKDDAIPTNKRRQTLTDILSLLKHYNAGARKDAIYSARELFQDHPALLERSVAPLLGACVRLIADEDAGVRKNVLSFFEWLFPRLTKIDLTPHVPMLLLFATSAQTHIFPEIRIDAVRFLDLLLDVVPESVVCGWNESGPGHGKRILEGYLGILSAGTKFGGDQGTAHAISTTSVVLSPQSKLVVLQSFSSFLSRAIDPRTRSGSRGEVNIPMLSVPTWFLRPSFANARQYEEHVNLLQRPLPGVDGKHLTWNANPEFESFDEDFAYDPQLLWGERETTWDLSSLSDLFSEMDDISRPLGDISLIMRLSRTLHPTLTAAFLDGAPVVFSPSANPSETEVQMLMAAFNITRTLYGAILQSDGQIRGSDLLVSCEELKTLLDYLTGYFPFTPAYREVKVEQAFEDLNVIYCELTSLLVLVSHQSGTRNVHRRDHFRGMPRKRDHSSTLQMDLVQSYVIRLLQGHGGSDVQLPRPISALTYIALLPTIWALLNQRSGQQPTGTEPSSVLMAMLDHAIRTGHGSAVKCPTIEFVGRLLLVEKEVGYTGNFRPRDENGAEHKFREWIIHLPKILWQVGTSNLATTHTILGVLLRLVQRESWVVSREQIRSLRSRLRPFFVVEHPIRGQILGPFSKFPTAAQVRRLALDLSAVLVGGEEAADETMDDRLYDAVSEAVKGTSEEPYWEAVTGAMRRG